jgi:predicted RNA-binding Zn-ribbon protein involved in translation (DUF1610 family)
MATIMAPPDAGRLVPCRQCRTLVGIAAGRPRAESLYSGLNGTDCSAGRINVALVITESILTCPQCGFVRREEMPAVSCWITYRCAGCGAELWADPGDCCVFCTYGSVPCPAVQQQRGERPAPPALG